MAHDDTAHLDLHVQTLMGLERAGLLLTTYAGYVDPASLGPRVLPDATRPERYLAQVRSALTTLLDWLDATARMVATFGEPGERERFDVPLTTARHQAEQFLTALEDWERRHACGDVAPGDVVPSITFYRPPRTPEEHPDGTV